MNGEKEVGIKNYKINYLFRLGIESLAPKLFGEKLVMAHFTSPPY